MRIACWIPKATNTYSEYVMLIAFPLQQWLYEHTSLLRYTYVHCCLFQSPPHDTSYNLSNSTFTYMYLKIRIVPHSKHTPSPLEHQSVNAVWGNNCYFLGESQ